MSSLLTLSEERKAEERRRAEANQRLGRGLTRTLIVALVICMGWNLIGTGVAMSSMHSTDLDRAQAVFWIGIGIGYCGTFFTALFCYLRGAERGDW